MFGGAGIALRAEVKACITGMVLPQCRGAEPHRTRCAAWPHWQSSRANAPAFSVWSSFVNSPRPTPLGAARYWGAS